MSAPEAEAAATIERLEALRKVERMLATKAEREGARRRANAAAITEAIDALGGDPGPPDSDPTGAAG